MIPSDSVSGAESDSSDVVFVDETSAVDPVGGRTGPDLVGARRGGAARAREARAGHGQLHVLRRLERDQHVAQLHLEKRGEDS